MSVAYDLDFVSPQQRPLALVRPLGAPAPALLPLGPPTRRGPEGAPGQASGAPGAASVSLLRPLHDPAPLRLTRRGVLALSVALAALGLAVVVFGALSARSADATPEPSGPAVVMVHAGDTVWSIASRTVPGQDPRAEIATIDRLNNLHGAALVPGQHLRVR